MDEYIHYVIELLQSQAIEAQYNEALRISTSESYKYLLERIAWEKDGGNYMVPS